MLYLIFFTIIIVILLFSSKTLSPIPYFPSQPTDIPLIIKALKLKNNQTIFDLGAGDGIVIFKAADESYKQKLNTQFIAVEINPILIFVLYIRRLFHPNRKNIKIIYGNMFDLTMKQSNNVTIYLYVSPWFLEKIIENLKMKNEKFKIVSYMYPIKSLKKCEKVFRGKNSIFVYDF